MRKLLFLLASVWMIFPMLAEEWTDRNEYDLVLGIRSEASPKKRLELLDVWSKKYPQTQLLQARLALYLAAYENLGDAPRMLDIARTMLTTKPNSPVTLFWCTVLVPQTAKSSPDVDLGEKAARQLLAGLDTFFNPANKSPAVAAEDWQKQKSKVEFLAHRTLGWTAWQRGNYADAAKELTVCLEKDPQSPEIAAWLGIVLALDKGKEVPALWQLSRAVTPGSPRALSSEQKREVNAAVERVYTSYHGAADGIDQLRTASAKSVFPTANFSIESATVVAARRAEEQLRRTNPELAAWLDLRKQLEAASGEQYFAENLKDKDLPKLKGTVVRCNPERYPKEIVVAMSESASEDVILKLKTPLPNGAEAGTPIAFQGTADSFAKEPFSVVVLVKKDNLEGWPEKATPARK